MAEWLSIYGLTLLTEDNIFDNLELPTQLSGEEDKVIGRLVLDTMELEVLYPEPDIFSVALGIYSHSRIDAWQKMADAMYHDYDPYINFTRDEVRGTTITRDLRDMRTDNLQRKRTANLTDGNTRTISRNAWDGSTAGSMTPAEQIADTGSLAGGTDTYNDTGTQSNQQSGTLTTEDYFHSQGDSALFTPTDIARKEFELRAELNLIEYIIKDIITHFCLMVY